MRGYTIGETNPLGIERRYRRGLDGEVLASEVRAGGTTLSLDVYERDLCGRLAAIVDAAGQRTTILFNAHDEIVQLDLPDGSRIDRSYSPIGELVGELRNGGRAIPSALRSMAAGRS